MTWRKPPRRGRVGRRVPKYAINTIQEQAKMLLTESSYSSWQTLTPAADAL